MRIGISDELVDVAAAFCLLDGKLDNESKAFLRMVSNRLADCAAEVRKMEGFILSGGPNRAAAVFPKRPSA